MRPTDYRWEHAVNSFELIEKVKKQIAHVKSKGSFQVLDYVNAIEADIIFSIKQNLPVMGHPPQVDNALTLEMFLNEMLALAKKFPIDLFDSNNCPLIIKLDFKSFQALESSFFFVQEFLQKFPFQKGGGIFINADILQGPVEAGKPIFFQAKDFFHLTKRLYTNHEEKIILSIGWTTSNDTYEEQMRVYTEEMIEEMLREIEKASLSNKIHITFPIRATCFQNSWHALERLFQANRHYGVTLWWAKTQLTTNQMKWLYETLEKKYPNRTFYDILGFDTFLKTLSL